MRQVIQSARSMGQESQRATGMPLNPSWARYPPSGRPTRPLARRDRPLATRHDHQSQGQPTEFPPARAGNGERDSQRNRALEGPRRRRALRRLVPQARRERARDLHRFLHGRARTARRAGGHETRRAAAKPSASGCARESWSA